MIPTEIDDAITAYHDALVDAASIYAMYADDVDRKKAHYERASILRENLVSLIETAMENARV